MTTLEQATKKSRKKSKGFGTNKGEPSVSRRNPTVKMSEAYRVTQDVREAARKCLMLHGKGVVYDSDDGITIAPYPTGDRFVDNMVKKS